MENNTNFRNKNIIIAICSIIIIILIIVGLYFAFIKKDDLHSNSTNNNQQQSTNNILVKKNLEIFAFDVILDTNGNVYIDLREDNIDSNNYPEISKLFSDAQVYNYNNKSEKLIKINLQNVKDIQCLDNGNGGTKYITFIDDNDKLYMLIDYVVQDNGDITLLTDDILNNVTKVYSECDTEACNAIADVNINGKKEKIYLYDLFEMYKPISYEKIKNELKKYDPSYDVSENKIKEISLNPTDDVYKFVLSPNGKVTVSKNDGKSIPISNINNAINIENCIDLSSHVYILLSNGDVYEYEVNNIDNQKYMATKIYAIKNAAKFVKISYARCQNCGGDILLGVLDKNNQYIELDSYAT